MKVAVYSPNGSISKSDYSHRAAWVKMMLATRGVTDFVLQPEDNLSNYDEVWVYLGMEWTGVLNLFGGASDDNAAKLVKLLEAKKIYFLQTDDLDKKMPQLGSIAEMRNGKASDGWLNAPWNELDKLCYNAWTIEQPFNEKLVIGDSHALCLYDGDSYISRNDHKTLNGALTAKLESFSNHETGFGGHTNDDKVTFCFGNIDLQHHLPRFSVDTTKQLAEEYVSQAANYSAIEIEIMELLPVFDETRKIATPGWYKGKPWAECWAKRNDLRNVFNSTLKYAADGTKVKIVPWPEYFQNEKGELNQEVMERPKGVHVAWANRREVWGE